MKPVRTLLAVALALAAAPSFAQTYSQTVFFGDSLTDSGTFRPALVQVLGASGASLGRFTTNPGLVWADRVAAYYGTDATPSNVGGTNYAVGGALVNANTSGGFGPIPSLLTQSTGYINGGRIDGDALYSVWGGANDLLTITPTTPPATAGATIGAAAAGIVSIVGNLQNAGARYVMVATIPDIGLTPRARAGGAAGMAGATQLSASYNNAVFGGLATAGLRVIPVDTFHLLQEIAASPSNYGFSNVTDPACRTQSAPAGDSSLFCNPTSLVVPGADQSYAFADSIHPTSAAHAIVGQLAISMLEAPRLIAGLPNSASMIGRARADRVAGHLGGKPDGDGMRWWSDLRGDFQRHGDSPYFDGEGPAITVGVDRISGDFVYGGFAGYGRQERIWEGDSGFDQSEATVGGFAAWYGDNAWISGQASYTGLSFDIDRRVVLGGVTRSHTGSADGSNLSVGGSAGWDFGVGALRHGPVVSVLSQLIEIDGYAESDASLSTSLAYSDQEYDSLIASVGWQMSYVADENFTPYARVTVDREFEDNADEAFARSQSIAGSGEYAVPGLEFDHDYGTVLLGARTKLFGLDTNFGTSVTLAQTTGHQVAVFVNVGSRF